MTRKTLTALAALTAVAVFTAAEVGGPASAQPADRGRPSATLYERDGFAGRSVTIFTDTPNLSSYGFNDRARSLRLNGLWRLCEHSGFEGRCVELQGDIESLDVMALAERISSLEPAGRAGRPAPDRGPEPGRGPGPGYGRGERGIEGDRTVFFPRPSVRGLDVAAGSNGANTFCRNQGLGSAVYYDSSARARRAIGPDGEVIGTSTVLRDLLCRK